MLQPGAVIDYLQSPRAIRERAGYLFDLACQDRLMGLACDLSRLESVADFVLTVIQETYPDGQIPVHSRWRHFERQAQPWFSCLGPRWQQRSAVDQVKAQLDLVIVSVLLDAGAGPHWRYCDPQTGQWLGRSEGLAIASLTAFAQGLFSADPTDPWRVDAEALQQLAESQVAAAFQVTPENPMVGLPGRCQLLRKLGAVLSCQPALFGETHPRPGNLVHYLESQAINGELKAETILKAILVGLGDIWPGRLTLAGVNLGDVWLHPALPDTGPGSQWVPFHKLSQWLTYSLLEPLQAYGLTVVELDALTGLAEYRNGGLCLDLGLFQPKSPAWQQAQPPDSPLIVEWRALTIIALDRIAEQIRARLGVSPEALPLPRVLQGGTWAAGRRIAYQKRPDGTPPISLQSDGTVF